MPAAAGQRGGGLSPAAGSRSGGPRNRALSGHNTDNSVPGGIFAAEQNSQNSDNGHAIRGFAGRNTGNSVAGGVFAKEMSQMRFSVDGMVNGRCNSSSVVGGIFAGEESNTRPGLRMAPNNKPPASSTTGVFGAGPPPVAFAGPARDPGPILGGGGHEPAGWGGGSSGVDGAAGGRASNASRDGFHGGGMRTRCAGPPSSMPMAYSVMGPTGSAPPHTGGDDFLARVDEAAARDEAETRHLQSLLAELEEQAGVINAAASQIAIEEQLNGADAAALHQKMMARVHEQAHALREYMASAAAAAAPATLAGILSRDAFAAGGAAAEDPWPASRGRGAYNPAHRPTSDVTTFHPTGGAPDGGAAGLGAGRVNAAHKELRIEHHTASRPGGSIVPTASKVSFAGNARILYPGATVMHRGKPPGY